MNAFDRRALRSVCAGAVLAAFGARAETFAVKLNLQNSHLPSLTFGCAAAAGPGYDRNHDEFAVPPGIETGYTVLVPPSTDRRVLPLYKDFRAAKDKIVWTVSSRVFAGKPVVFTWDRKRLPETYELTVDLDGESRNMRTFDRLELTETRTFTITAVRRPRKPPPATP